MVSDYKEILSDSAKGMKRSAIRELLKLTQKPEIMSQRVIINFVPILSDGRTDQ